MKIGDAERTDSISCGILGTDGKLNGGSETFMNLGRDVVLMYVEVETIEMDGAVVVVAVVVLRRTFTAGVRLTRNGFSVLKSINKSHAM